MWKDARVAPQEQRTRESAALAKSSEPSGGPGDASRRSRYVPTGLSLRMVAVVMLVPLALVAVNVTVTDSCAPPFSAASALLGRLIVSVRAACAWAEPRAFGSGNFLLRFLPCLGLSTSVSLPCSVTSAAWSHRTTNASVPGLRLDFSLCVVFLAAGSSTLALLARIVHDGPAITTAVGAEFAGWPAPAALDAVSTSRMV